MNIRPVAKDASGNPAISYPADYVPPVASESAAATPTESGASTSGSAAETAPTTIPAIGDTTPASAPSVDETVAPGTDTAAATTAASEAPAGLRAPQNAAVAPAPAVVEDSATPESTPAATESAVTPATDAPVSGTPVSGTDAVTTGTAAAAPAWPAGSNPENPTQPLGTDQAAWTAWQTAAVTALPTLKCADLEPYRGLDDPTKPLIACDVDGTAIYVLESTLIAGTQIETATSGQSSQGAGWVVNLSFKSEGYATWSSYTAANTGTLTAMTLDGQVISAPRISGPITTPTTEISGSFTQTSAAALANSLKFGALPLAFDRAESVNVSAELGLEYLKAGLIAGGIGLLLVIIYCLLYYRLLGVITILSLILSFGIVYAVLVLLGRWVNYSLDMAGVAGLIIAIGITADSFVIYFERIKDEVREGRTFRSAVPRGWQRAKRTILSADAVSFMSAAILYVLAVGQVKGFAFTLGLSTVLDLVVVFLVTHPLVALAAGSPLFSSPTWSGLGSVAKAGASQRAENARVGARGGTSDTGTKDTKGVSV
jgi:preprotein translocase subunit SecD